MGEFSEAIKQRYAKQKNSEIIDKMNKQRVKVGILTLCDEYLKEAGELLTFECGPNDLQYVVTAITEDPLVSKYNIMQIGETLFEASLVEVDLGLT